MLSRKLKKGLVVKATAVIALALILTLTGGFVTNHKAVAAHPPDVQKSWARDSINALVDKKIMNLYADGTFGPAKNVTRAKFSSILAKAFALDARVADGFVGTKDRAGNITRAEAVAALDRALKLGDQNDRLGNDWNPTYADVLTSHKAFKYVEIGKRLGIIPPIYTDAFGPDKAATRADVAYMVKSAMDLQVTTGTVASVNAQQNSFTVKPVAGPEQMFVVPPDAALFRNSSPARVENLMQGDAVQIVTDIYGSPKFVKAAGALTRADVTSKVSQLTKGALTPDQVQAAMSGNWKAVAGTMKFSLYNRLVSMGVTPIEAESIVSQDWNGLKGVARERLAQALSQQLNVAPEVGIALLDRNWKQLEGMVEIQLAQKLLSKLSF